MLSSHLATLTAWTIVLPLTTFRTENDNAFTIDVVQSTAHITLTNNCTAIYTFRTDQYDACIKMVLSSHLAALTSWTMILPLSPPELKTTTLTITVWSSHLLTLQCTFTNHCTASYSRRIRYPHWDDVVKSFGCSTFMNNGSTANNL